MALIKCPECAREISDRAPVCPNCGVPIAVTSEQKINESNMVTIQETSKRLKGLIIISTLLIAGGFLLFFKAGTPMRPISALIIIIGLILYFITKFNIWWYHK